jgi:hypothetical protein
MISNVLLKCRCREYERTSEELRCNDNDRDYRTRCMAGELHSTYFAE